MRSELPQFRVWQPRWDCRGFGSAQPAFYRRCMDLPRHSRQLRVARFASRAALAAGALLVIASLLFVSLTPSVEAQSRPSARDLQAARQVWQQLKAAQGAAAVEVRVDDRMISGLSALARDGSGVNRLDVGVSEGRVLGRASLNLPLGLWLNASAIATGSHEGFPSFRLTVGQLNLPAAAGRPLANFARWALRAKGADIPPLDAMFESFTVEKDHLRARVKLPSKTRLVGEAIAARSSAVDPQQVSAILCRIAGQQRAAPVQTLPELTRRTFAAPESDTDSHARAAFVALAIAVVGARAEALLPQDATRKKQCPFPEGSILLWGRADLAKHWVLSAALTATLGPEVAERLGELKELDDSRADGSGFSFVDLAADRAGVQIAIAALKPETALATQERLRGATESYILPPALLKGSEGLSDAAFAEQFGGLAKRNYRTAVSRIDALLARELEQEASVRR